MTHASQFPAHSHRSPHPFIIYVRNVCVPLVRVNNIAHVLRVRAIEYVYHRLYDLPAHRGPAGNSTDIDTLRAPPE